MVIAVAFFTLGFGLGLYLGAHDAVERYWMGVNDGRHQQSQIDAALRMRGKL